MATAATPVALAPSTTDAPLQPVAPSTPAAPGTTAPADAESEALMTELFGASEDGESRTFDGSLRPSRESRDKAQRKALKPIPPKQDARTPFERVTGKTLDGKTVAEDGEIAEPTAEAADPTKKKSGTTAADIAGYGTVTDSEGKTHRVPIYAGEYHQIEIGGKRYTVPSAVTSNVKTLQGQFKAFHRRATEGVESARAWEAHANKLQNQITQLRSNPQAQPSTSPNAQHASPASPAAPSSHVSGAPANGEAPMALLKQVNWKAFDAEYKQNPASAIGYLLTEIEQHVAAREAALETRLAAYIDPLHAQSAQVQEVSHASTVMDKMADLKDGSGALVFPELSVDNPQLLTAIVKTWQELPGDLPKTERGFYLAMLQIRDHARARGLQLVPSQSAPTTNPGTSSHQAAEMLREAASVMSGGTGAPSPMVEPRPMSESDRIIAEIEGRTGGVSSDVYAQLGLRAPRR